MKYWPSLKKSYGIKNIREPHAIHLTKLANPLLLTKVFLPPKNFWDPEQPPQNASETINQLKQKGVVFPEDATAEFFSKSGKLVVRNSVENLDQLTELVAATEP